MDAVAISVCPTCGRRPSERYSPLRTIEGLSVPATGTTFCDGPLHDEADRAPAGLDKLRREVARFLLVYGGAGSEFFDATLYIAARDRLLKVAAPYMGARERDALRTELALRLSPAPDQSAPRDPHRSPSTPGAAEPSAPPGTS